MLRNFAEIPLAESAEPSQIACVFGGNTQVVAALVAAACFLSPSIFLLRPFRKTVKILKLPKHVGEILRLLVLFLGGRGFFRRGFRNGGWRRIEERPRAEGDGVKRERLALREKAAHPAGKIDGVLLVGRAAAISEWICSKGRFASWRQA